MTSPKSELKLQDEKLQDEELQDEKLQDELLDLGSLSNWLVKSGEILKSQQITGERLDGGQSNALFTLHISQDGKPLKSWVLRRPRLVSVKRAGEGIKREYKILKALSPTEVPVPEPIVLCEDVEILGCEFLIMSKLEGFAPTAELPTELPTELPAEFQDQKPEIASAMITTLAKLHNLDYVAQGLQDFGNPTGFHTRQNERWSKQLASYQGREIPELANVGEWISANAPQDFEPTIMHADYHMFNVLIAPDFPVRVAGILDWETATIGDPMLDLAGFLEVWCPTHSGNGWPDETSLLKEYLSAIKKQINIEQINYYRVLYNFKMAVLLEGIYQRSLQDSSREPATSIGERALFNAGRAQNLIAV